jgi:hypothetical protein
LSVGLYTCPCSESSTSVASTTENANVQPVRYALNLAAGGLRFRQCAISASASQQNKLNNGWQFRVRLAQRNGLIADRLTPVEKPEITRFSHRLDSTNSGIAASTPQCCSRSTPRLGTSPMPLGGVFRWPIGFNVHYWTDAPVELSQTDAIGLLRRY